MQINQNRMFNNGVLLNGVLIHKLINNPFASCSLINLDFLLPQTTHFDDKANLPFLVFIVFASLFLYFFYTLNNVLTCLFYNIIDPFFIRFLF